ncbi:hypothetical protein [Neisseria canis]|uniref:hypothetical protein n=1 Tax=Neisseria canis TaxID=493 RepID=UPI001E57CAA5|nr:hypothetical protein [Neisseria canis]
MDNTSPELIASPFLASVIIFPAVKVSAAGAVAIVPAGPAREATALITCPPLLNILIGLESFVTDDEASAVVINTAPYSIVFATDMLYLFQL